MNTSSKSFIAYKTLRNLLGRKVFLKYFSIVSVVLIVYLLISIGQVKKQIQDVVADREAEIESVKMELEILKSILEIDEQVIVEGAYSEALLGYTEILKHHQVNKEGIQRRINQLNEILNSRNSNEKIEYNPLELVVRQNNILITALEERLDSLSNQSRYVVDSLHGSIVRLNQLIDLKNKELNKKERVKVISFISEKGVKVHYMGEVADDKANGGGIGIWTTGSVYKGQWKDNLRNGQGTYEWADGEKYEGEYVNGKREGTGTYYWPSGERYKGEWKNDKRNGKGTLYDQDGNIRYEGNWMDDKPVKN